MRSVNAANDSSRTALHLATERERPELAELLITRGAVVSARDLHGHTPLHEATLSLARLLIRNSTDINVRDNAKAPPGDYAALRGNSEPVELLIAAGATTRSAGRGRSGLSGVARHGWKDLADLFLRHGGDPNERRQGGETPLYDAVRYDHADVVASLIKYGAEVNVTDDGGRSPLH